MNSALTRQQIIEDVGKVKGLPPYPGVVTEVEAEFSKPEPSLQLAAAIIERDPALSAGILRLANSALRRGRSEISSVAQAAIRLGLRETRRVLLSAAFVQKWPKAPGIDQQAFWRHALTVGLTATRLSTHRTDAAPPGLEESCFAAGLLHDLGSLVLAHTYPEHYSQLLAQVAEGGTSLDALELSTWGIEHGEVGELLATRWQLPDPLRAAISCHHRPWLARKEHRILVYLVHVADFLSSCQGLGAGQDGWPQELDPVAWDTLGFKIEEVHSLFAGVTEQGDVSKDWIVALQSKAE
jgi:HD-like signal output (HDOD) protein